MKKEILVLLLTLCPLCLRGEFFGCTRARPTAEQMATGGVLERPVVVIAGYVDIGIGDRIATRQMRKLTGDGRILAVHPGTSTTFSGAADRVIDAVDATFGGGTETETIEVDIIAISMGGITARWAAMPGARFGKSNRRLKIGSLFTICAPHTGAQMANNFAWADLFLTARSMRTGSDLYKTLARREASASGDERYPIVQYARENDMMIGPGSDLPEHLWDRGQVIWLGMPFWRTGHAGSYSDDRILGDIARRLMDNHHEDTETRRRKRDNGES